MSKQFYGIKYPFSRESNRLTFVDINETNAEGVRSMLLHIIFTPKGQRIRQPEFGTNLINFIFDQNDELTWDGIKEEIRTQISRFLPQVKFNDISIQHNENEEHSIYVEIDYSIEENGKITENKTLVKL